MKLEMRVYNLDVKLELNDDDNFDALEILQGVKNLLDELSNFDIIKIIEDMKLTTTHVPVFCKNS